MEQHPVPQNVTTFQFRLVGDMTIKQFGYLAVGLLLAYICYKLPLPSLITWPLALSTALLGFGLAFVPVEERPMDAWIMSFFRNIYAPTQYVWKKAVKKSPSRKIMAVASTLSVQAADAKQKRIASLVSPFVALLSRMRLTKVPSVVRLHKTGVLDRLFGSKHQSPSIVMTPSFATIVPRRRVSDFFNWLLARGRHTDLSATTLSPGVASPAGTKPGHVSAGQRLATPETAVIAQKQQFVAENPHDASAVNEVAHKRILELQNELSRLLTDRERLTKEVATLKAEDRVTSPTTVVVGPGVVPLEQAKPTIRAVAPGASARIGVPRLTAFPNIVTGIVKDENGMLLSGILITVRDAGDIPIRAFKTNRVGQFAASTQLPNGLYVVEAEDPRGERVFDRVQITTTGVIMPTLEIFAKSKKQQSRDALAKEIFGHPLT